MTSRVDTALAVLNGAVGDYLSRSGNGLALPMTLVHDGRVLALDGPSLAKAYPAAGRRVVVLVHGLMCTESMWTLPDGTDYGALLARDLGYTPLYVRYNSGLAIPDNGAAFASLLETLLGAYPAPIEELVLLGYSMGGLVIRSACHVAALEGHAWLARVRRAIYVGTPHRGAPFERLGRVVAKLLGSIDDPYTRLIADIARLRSDGIQDLGDADLRHEDRARRTARFSLRDPRHPVPLLASIRHYLVAGALWREPWLAASVGDILVPLDSGTDGACASAEAMAIPPAHVKIIHGVAHLNLGRCPEVYGHVRAFCEETT